ncbi:MAG: VCBS repeat-containing protein [Candidatus Altiarchaeota archaeon]
MASYCEAAFRDYMELSWNSTMKEVLSGLVSADLNGDGNAEVVVSTSTEGAVYAFDSKGKKLWMYNTMGYVNDVIASDLDGDSYKEIITSTSGHVYAINHRGEKVWSFLMSRNDARNLGVGDLDGDGSKEVIVGPYASNCKESIIFVINASGNKFWSYSLGNYYGNVIASGDLDGDGKDEVIVGTMLRALDSSRMMCDPSKTSPAKIVAIKGDGKKLWEYGTEGGVTVLEVSDLDGDGMREVIAGSYPKLYVIDYTGKLVWDYKAVTKVDSIAVGDLEGDKLKEVIVGANNVYAFNNMGVSLWYGATNDRVYNVEVADLDNTGFSEVIAASDKVYVFDKVGELLWNSEPLRTVHKLDISDFESDNYREIVAGAIEEVIAYKTGSKARRNYADEYLQKAKDDLAAGRYEKGLDNAINAKGLYSRLGLMNDVSTAIELIDSLNRSASMLRSESEQADKSFKIAKESFDAGDFWNASNYAMIARSKYSAPEIMNRTLIGECEGIINRSNEALYENATFYYNKALADFQEGRLDSALQQAGVSAEIFKHLRDDEGVKGSEFLISQIQAKAKSKINLKGVSSRLRMPNLDGSPYVGVIVSAVVLLVFVLLVAYFIVKKVRTPKMSKEEIRSHLQETATQQNRKVETEHLKPKVMRERPKFTRDHHRRIGKAIPRKR